MFNSEKCDRQFRIPVENNTGEHQACYQCQNISDWSWFSTINALVIALCVFQAENVFVYISIQINNFDISI